LCKGFQVSTAFGAFGDGESVPFKKAFYPEGTVPGKIIRFLVLDPDERKRYQ
jgi:hypothetical protein